MAVVWDNFPDAWADYWGVHDRHAPEHLAPDLWEETKRLHSVAQRLVRAAAELSRTKLPDQTRTLPRMLEMEAASERKARRELLESLRTQVASEALESPEWRQIENYLRWEDSEAGNKERLFGTAVEIHAFELWGCSPVQLARRCLELLDFLVRVRGVRAREYLRRVSNCYIRGMRPELAVMARSVLESALEDLEIDGKVEEIRKLRRKPHNTARDAGVARTERGLPHMCEDYRMTDSVHEFVFLGLNERGFWESPGSPLPGDSAR